jgi:hypothetical protein
MAVEAGYPASIEGQVFSNSTGVRLGDGDYVTISDTSTTFGGSYTKFVPKNVRGYVVGKIKAGFEFGDSEVWLTQIEH